MLDILYISVRQHFPSSKRMWLSVWNFPSDIFLLSASLYFCLSIDPSCSVLTCQAIRYYGNAECDFWICACVTFVNGRYILSTSDPAKKWAHENCLKISFLRKLIISPPIKVILTLLKYLNLTQNGPKFLFSLKNLNDFNVWPHIIRTTWLENILCKFTTHSA